MKRVHLGADVGGTFTDAVAVDTATGEVRVAKPATTPDDRARGTLNGMASALDALGAPPDTVAFVGHGTTTATNALINRDRVRDGTGRPVRVAMVCNAGLRDVLEIGRQDRPKLYDLSVTRPAPLVAREDRHGIGGRLDSRGDEIEPLDLDELLALAERIASDPPSAVAVCLLHAYANPAHERAVGEALKATLPREVPVCLSTDLAREFREYERASTTVLNAWLLPVMRAYLGALEARVRAPQPTGTVPDTAPAPTHRTDAPSSLGVPTNTPLRIMDAAGGLMSAQRAAERPVHTVLSGPAAGVVAAAAIGKTLGLEQLITLDMGGTSTDLSLVQGGAPRQAREARIEGFPVRVPLVDINAIGAGGGSIAWLDEGGALRVGPHSAEAVPGPACYARGGERATVSDANLVLGRLGAGTALGGELVLDAALAAAAVERDVAVPAGLDVEAAALGIVHVANANIERGIRVVSVERGHDPREFTLAAFGGAGPLHALDLARTLDIPRVLVPRMPGLLCALGLLMAEQRHVFVRTRFMPLDPEDAHAAWLDTAFAELVEEADRALDDDGIEADRRRVERYADVRYRGQSHELTVPVDGNATLIDAFHTLHRQRFGHARERRPVELVNLRVVARGQRAPLELSALPPADGSPRAREQRDLCFEAASRRTSAHVFDRATLRAGHRIEGPAVIEELSATTLLGPGDRAQVLEQGHLLIDVAEG